MSTTEIRGELVELGWNAEMDSNRALVRCTLGAIEALEPNLTLQGPASVAIIAAAELAALRNGLRELLAELRREDSNWVGPWEDLEKFDELAKEPTP